MKAVTSTKMQWEMDWELSEAPFHSQTSEARQKNGFPETNLAFLSSFRGSTQLKPSPVSGGRVFLKPLCGGREGGREGSDGRVGGWVGVGGWS